MTKELSTYQKEIVRYYDATWLDYRVLWLNRRNRAVHFGYFDETVTEHADALENLNRIMAKTVNIGAGDKVLDAGCGQGGSTMWLAEHTDASAEGITLVGHQVRQATKFAVQRNLADKVRFSLQDYCNTSFPDNSFSVVWACESLCHAQQKLQFYKEAMRVLKPGGRLIIAEYIRAKRPLTGADETLLADWLNRWSIEDIDTWEEHERNMTAAGFEQIALQDSTKNVIPSLRHLYSMSKKLLPLGRVLQKVGLRNVVNHGNHVGSINQYLAIEKQLWFYGIFSACKPLKHESI